MGRILRKLADSSRLNTVVLAGPPLLLSLFLLQVLRPSPPLTVSSPVEMDVEPEDDPPVVEPQARVFEDRFPRNSTLRDVLFRFNFTPRDIHQLIEETRAVYDLNRVRAGNQFTIETLPDGTFQSLRYQISDEEYLLARYEGDHYTASRHRYEFEITVEETFGVLEESLYRTLKDSGEADQLVVDLVEILQWDIDFTTLQPGDWFKLIFEKKSLQGQFVKYGEIYAVQFHSGGRDFFGFRFEHPGRSRFHYFDEKGNSLRKAFLKVPFRFSPRISSGFSHSRLHPILKKRRPHLALDFAAPRGTPVLASANGTVVFAGWKGGYGRMVKIKHPNGFVTSYAHLSSILVKAGQKVEQSQAIGKVGATGLATAPHLDYRIQDARGRFVNPRQKISWPSDKPVEKPYWSQFAAVRDRLLDQLAAVPGQPSPPQLAKTE